jgi:hypothetical protein
MAFADGLSWYLAAGLWCPDERQFLAYVAKVCVFITSNPGVHDSDVYLLDSYRAVIK